MSEEIDNIQLTSPSLVDGMAVHQLVANCPPLDPNSSYCNFLQCGHFSQTSVAARRGDQLLGFISGYLVPERQDTLFIWQVAVSPEARGLGLASRMLDSILARPACRAVRFLETTITDDNQASWSLFRALGKRLSSPLSSSVWLDASAHFNGQHDSEHLVRIGPFNPPGESQ
ncbi:diaminobutyrate acetyltransferase [Hydrogenophaga sp. 5NK40-0174]|uniref:diaminobutyrate acetyltransferase n=1 Tax=Hydrogenophaga sp. 5NK40-0174 TaxID=3127649 RepID=UPI00333FBA5E